VEILGTPSPTPTSKRLRSVVRLTRDIDWQSSLPQDAIKTPENCQEKNHSEFPEFFYPKSKHS
jgi:hypothetical protein